MRPQHLGVVLALATACALAGAPASADDAPRPKAASGAKPWCGPDVTELSDHVCFFDGGVPADGRRTLVIYLHGSLATTPGFQYLQQQAMALHAKRHNFTVVIPTSPGDASSFVWPTSQQAQKDQEPGILAGLKKARAGVEKRVGHPFDETFVVGFSSGAYYGSSLAVRGALDVDGYIVLAGGSSWVRSDQATNKRVPVFVGVSAADPQTAAHSRSFGGSLMSMGWPAKVEERNAGHMVDWTFMAHGIAWLRERKSHGAGGVQNVSITQ
jgi:predicted esterase